jgi:hypothetical protein
MSIDLVRNARFNGSTPIVQDGKETFGTWKKPNFLTSPFQETVTYVVDNTKMGRADLIANEVYGTCDLYWVVIAAMRPMNPTNWPKTGDVLYLPSQAEVFAQLIA